MIGAGISIFIPSLWGGSRFRIDPLCRPDVASSGSRRQIEVPHERHGWRISPILAARTSGMSCGGKRGVTASSAHKIAAVTVRSLPFIWSSAFRRAKINVRFAAKQSKSRWGAWLPLAASQSKGAALALHRDA